MAFKFKVDRAKLPKDFKVSQKVQVTRMAPGESGPGGPTGPGPGPLEVRILPRDEEEREKRKIHYVRIIPDEGKPKKPPIELLDNSQVDMDAIEVDYDIDLDYVLKYMSIDVRTVNEVVINLKSGRNVILYGPPGTGKTKLTSLVCDQLCGKVPDPITGKDKENYSIVTANAEWSNFELIGGIQPTADDKGNMTYQFKDGYLTEAAKMCHNSVIQYQKPHYLIIDEFNRANIDEAFGKIFTVTEYRDKQPLLNKEENEGKEFMLPRDFRMIGTMNTDDKNTLFEIGHALMRRFAFLEVGLADPKDEYDRLHEFVMHKFITLGTDPETTKASGKPVDPGAKKFDYYDSDGEIQKVFDKLIRFLEEEKRPEAHKEIPRGVRTYRKLGTAILIDSMIYVINSRGIIPLEEALEDVIFANVFPQLDGLEKEDLINIKLKAVEVLGTQSRVTRTMEEMISRPSLSVFG